MIQLQILKIREYIYDIYTLYKKLGKDALILFVRDTSRCFKMDTIGKTRYFGKTGISADGCFSSIVACKSKSFEFMNDVCYFWHLHEDSLSGRKKTIEKIEEELCVWTEFFTWITTSSQTKNIPDPIIDYLFIYKELIDVLYREGRTEFATKHEIHLKKFMIKILNNHTISAKSRVKIKYPGIYKVYMNARGIIIG